MPIFWCVPFKRLSQSISQSILFRFTFARASCGFHLMVASTVQCTTGSFLGGLHVRVLNVSSIFLILWLKISFPPLNITQRKSSTTLIWNETWFFAIFYCWVEQTLLKVANQVWCRQSFGSKQGAQVGQGVCIFC